MALPVAAEPFFLAVAIHGDNPDRLFSFLLVEVLSLVAAAGCSVSGGFWVESAIVSSLHALTVPSGFSAKLPFKLGIHKTACLAQSSFPLYISAAASSLIICLSCLVGVLSSY